MSEVKDVIFNFEIEFSFNDGSENKIIIEPLWLIDNGESKSDREEVLDFLINKFNNPDIGLISLVKISKFQVSKEDIKNFHNDKVQADNDRWQEIELQNRQWIEGNN